MKTKIKVFLFVFLVAAIPFSKGFVDVGKQLLSEDFLSFSLCEHSELNNDSQAHCFMFPENFGEINSLQAVESEYYPNFKAISEQEKFKGKARDKVILTAMKNETLLRFFFLGIGDMQSAYVYENIREATGIFVNVLKDKSIETATIYLPSCADIDTVNVQEIIKQVVIAAKLAFYEFNALKKDKKTKNIKLWIACDNVPEDASNYLSEAVIIGNAVNRARLWGDFPANIMSPDCLASQAEKLAGQYGCQCCVFGEEHARKLGMGGFVAVGSGTGFDSKFIIVEYNAQDSDAPTIILVGKGITHDSGGLSLKQSSPSMVKMKYDMCGGAAVLATVFACAQLKPNVNIVGIVPAVENKIGENCYRPGDVITMMNGKTVEVMNTDAEGRLILADALCYVEENYNPSVIIDVATLTGSCVTALGSFYSGVMTRSDKLCKRLEEASVCSGDCVWRLPLSKKYDKSLKSNFADVKNCSSSAVGAGATTAACFIGNFVSDTAEWAHLDIASTAWHASGTSYLSSKFARGSSVRLLIDFIMNYQENSE